MNDPEASRRLDVARILSPTCDCAEHVRVRLAVGESGQVDVLCRPKEPTLSGFAFAIEVKSYTQIGDRELGPWLKQAADYVGARPENNWQPIAASFVWLVGINLDPRQDEQCRMAGMFQLAQHFRVGKACDFGRGLVLVFGPSAEIYHDGTWSPRAATLLAAKRVLAGRRQSLRARESNS